MPCIVVRSSFKFRSQQSDRVRVCFNACAMTRFQSCAVRDAAYSRHEHGSATSYYGADSRADGRRRKKDDDDDVGL